MRLSLLMPVLRSVWLSLLMPVLLSVSLFFVRGFAVGIRDVVVSVDGVAADAVDAVDAVAVAVVAIVDGADASMPDFFYRKRCYR